MARTSILIAEAWFSGDGRPIPWRRWGALATVAVGGSLFYGASLGWVLADWKAVSAALWMALSAGLAWGVLIPVLCHVGNLRFAPCFDACLVTMAAGEGVLTLGTAMNGWLWWQGAVGHASLINGAIVAMSNVVMASFLVRRLRPHGVPTRRVWAVWMLALNGSGAAFFLVFYHWFHGT